MPNFFPVRCRRKFESSWGWRRAAALPFDRGYSGAVSSASRLHKAAK